MDGLSRWLIRRLIRECRGDTENDDDIYQKENGGQASARKFRSRYVEVNWVTIIDPDDFVDSRYFETIDRL